MSTTILPELVGTLASLPEHTQKTIKAYGAACARTALQSQDLEDAQRYRWLRNRAIAEGICVVHIDYWSEEYRGLAHCEVYDGESLDKAIDHARRIEGEAND